MSRAYRIQVRESLRRVLRAQDRVSTQLELLEVLPPEQMAQLLTEELKGRGFEDEDGALVRRQSGVAVTVDPKTGTLIVEAEAAEHVAVKGEKVVNGYDDIGPQAKTVRKQLKQELAKQLVEKSAELQSQVTEKLEKHLGELRQELDGAVNRVTAEALKQKARQMGRIKEMTEDPQTGSLTLVVEV